MSGWPCAGLKQISTYAVVVAALVGVVVMSAVGKTSTDRAVPVNKTIHPAIDSNENDLLMFFPFVIISYKISGFFALLKMCIIDRKSNTI